MEGRWPAPPRLCRCSTAQGLDGQPLGFERPTQIPTSRQANPPLPIHSATPLGVGQFDLPPLDRLTCTFIVAVGSLSLRMIRIEADKGRRRDEGAGPPVEGH